MILKMRSAALVLNDWSDGDTGGEEIGRYLSVHVDREDESIFLKEMIFNRDGQVAWSANDECGFWPRGA